MRETPPSRFDGIFKNQHSMAISNLKWTEKYCLGKRGSVFWYDMLQKVESAYFKVAP